MRIYNALCAYIEARAANINAHTKQKGRDDAPGDDHQPEGNNFASAERAGESDRNHALNNNDRPGHYGQAISLKWWPKE